MALSDLESTLGVRPKPYTPLQEMAGVSTKGIPDRWILIALMGLEGLG